MYFLRFYAVPFVLAVLLHLLAVVALTRGFNPDKSVSVREIKPRIVQSELIVLEPKPKRAAAPKPKPKPMLTPQPVQAPPEPKPAPKVAPKPDPAKLKAEQERKDREQKEKDRKAEREKRLQDLASQSFLDALEMEDQQLQEIADAADAAADDVAAQSYRMGIYQAVVANWSRPPSARQGMQAKLLVELVPTGDVVSVSLLESSGNGSFDRSAESAVNKAGRFEVPKESEIFERYFRKFTLLFRPEDLLR